MGITQFVHITSGQVFNLHHATDAVPHHSGAPAPAAASVGGSGNIVVVCSVCGGDGFLRLILFSFFFWRGGGCIKYVVLS